MILLNAEMMSEVEVSLRLAFYLAASGLTTSPVQIAIDGAQVQTGERVHFDILSFLHSADCRSVSGDGSWRGSFQHTVNDLELVIHSHPGRGDVVAKLNNGSTLRVESKKGALVRRRGSREYALMHEALGQILTVAQVNATDLLAIAVPHSAKFEELAARWRRAPLVQKAGIQILTVGRDNQVHGLKIKRSENVDAQQRRHEGDQT